MFELFILDLLVISGLQGHYETSYVSIIGESRVPHYKLMCSIIAAYEY